LKTWRTFIVLYLILIRYAFLMLGIFLFSEHVHEYDIFFPNLTIIVLAFYLIDTVILKMIFFFLLTRKYLNLLMTSPFHKYGTN
jgi:hypothetical protein